jgi:hypothetical protein
VKYFEVCLPEVLEVLDMKAVKKFAEVGSDKSLILKSLPFPPGSKVEVIVLPAADEEDVFALMDKIVKKRGIKPLTMKQVERIVHDTRGVR